MSIIKNIPGSASAIARVEGPSETDRGEVDT